MDVESRNLFSKMDEHPNNAKGHSNGHLTMSTEEIFEQDDKKEELASEQGTGTLTAIVEGDPGMDGTREEGTQKMKMNEEKNIKENLVQDVRRSSRHDKDFEKIMKVNKIDSKTAELNEGNILPSLRRSNRSNKGVSREMFDPSHIPSPKHKSYLNPPQEKHQENSNKKGSSIASDSSDGKPGGVIAKKETTVSKEENEVEESNEEQEESDSDSDDDEYNDPNKLWCICKKPHNGRFMISCDVCEEWFHGDCVGVTVQRGRQMERKGEEYVCPACLGNDSKTGKHRKNSEQESKETSGVKLKGYAHDKNEKHKKRKQLMKRMKNRESLSKESDHKRLKNTQLPVGKRKCIVSTCHNKALSDSVYCSNVCILRHAKESISGIDKVKQSNIDRRVSGEKQESKDERIMRKIKEASSRGKVAVMCRKTGKIFANASAPRKEDLSLFLKKNPTFQPLRPPKIIQKKSPTSEEKRKHSKESHHKKSKDHIPMTAYDKDDDYKPVEKKPSNPYKHLTPTNLHSANSLKPKKHKIERQESYESKKSKHKRHDSDRRSSIDKNAQKITPSKRDSRSLSDDKGDVRKDPPSHSEKELRRNVRNSLHGILQNRSNNSDDLKMHSDSITRLVNKIEDSLYKLFGSVSSKYKNRYRSIMFNLKDEKNHGLWRKVILGEVLSSNLVKMTAEEMASKELAKWREHELTQELEMIHELETAEKNIRPVSKITHKGEIAINEDFSDLTESHLDDSNEKSGSSFAPQRIRRISANQPDTIIDLNPLAADTTSEHSKHLFDMNCRICTGQMKEEDAQLDGNNKKVKRSTSIIMSNEAQTTVDTEHTEEEILKKISAFSNKKEKSLLISINSEKSVDDDSETVDHTKHETIAEKEKSPVTKKEPIVSPEKLSRERFIWSGMVSMPELSSFRTNAYTVSGSTKELINTIPNKLVLDGRIHPKVVWEYLEKVRSFSNKEVCVVQFRASSEDDRVGYVSMLSYFSSRRRFGVVSNQNTQVIKDIYLVPLLETDSVPGQLLPFNGPGIPPEHPSMLLGVIVRCIPEKKSAIIEPELQSSKFDEKQQNRSKIGEDNFVRRSLLDRNKLLTSAMPHFTQKDAKEEDEEEYNPETADFENITDDDINEPDSAADKNDEEEAYDPEKLVFDNDTKEEDDAPYDPEVEAERLANTELKALQEKQAFLEKMKQELEAKKAELAKEEMTLQNQTPPPPPPLPIKTVSQTRVDPRIAARMHNKSKPANSNSTVPQSETPLQKIFSVLKFDNSKPS